MTDQNKIKHYDYIDAVRGMAILLVVIVHVVQSVPGIPEVLAKVLAKGQYGVQMFFIASALTLFMSYSQREKIDGADTKKFFFIRRFFRIAPVYYLAILLYGSIKLIFPLNTAPNELNIGYVLLTVTFLNGIYPSNETINYIPPGGWSIAVEMIFYLLIPLLFRKINTLKRGIIFLLSCIGHSLLLKIGLRFFITNYTSIEYAPLESWFLYFWLPNQLPVFAMGILLYLLLKNKPSFALQPATINILLVTALSALVLIIIGSFYFNIYFLYSEHLLISLVFALFVFILSQKRIPFFVNKYTMALGKVSFSLYLVHFIVIRFAAYAVNRIIDNSYIALLSIFILTVLIGYLISHQLYQLIELRGMKMGKKLIDKLKVKASPSSTKAY